MSWDDELPMAIANEWKEVKNNLNQLEKIRIPRYTGEMCDKVQLHGFSDASEQAYAAVVYLRVLDAAGHARVTLMAAKSRVAPIKQISLPRLELNGALLLAELMAKVTTALAYPEPETWAWTDSTIVLNWLSAHPRKWNTFVANRTSAILETLPRSCWNHVKSKDNPADCLSRGLSPAEFIDHPLWFRGPQWLSEDSASWVLSAPPTLEGDLPEAKPVKSLHLVAIHHRDNYDVEEELLERRSSFTLIVRTLAYMNRWAHHSVSKDERHGGELTPVELQAATSQLCRAIQNDVFGPEIKRLRKGKSIKPKHILAPLYPFLDKFGTMRVGGRLQHSNQPYDVKHPIILPQNHRGTELLVRELHLRNLHAGPTLLTSVAYQKYWIVGCQTVVRRIVQGCIRCVRLKGKTANQLMGNLPPSRVLATRPFSHVGVDYAGPIKLKALCVRGVKITKGYIAVFVCLSTRAVHVEGASDLSTNTFLSTLKRFISRRGYPVEICSDQGTNFVGADRALREFLDHLQSNSKDVSKFLSNIGIKWSLTRHPPHIWEGFGKPR
ncbi:uncharacterized protein LOC129742510 [Uranotaenia lowii]|uniref:uncharacterized protein LOC129742510 n=1 Tax=Uranotaenia lowii TaxID=190385 RepID=UPI0024797A4C|nr:uncharacterized protein LOC129742510 [Uranotaenia lowii]